MNTDLDLWLETNRPRLIVRAPNEVVELAVRCGFDVREVCKRLSHFHSAVQGWDIDKCTQRGVKRTVAEIKAFCGQSDLEPQWLALYNHLEHGIDFNDEL